MSEIDIRRSPTGLADQANPAPAGHNGGPPLDQSTRRNGATTELEITFTGRRRIARPGKTPRPASSRFASKKPNGWASPTKNTRWKFSNAAVISRSRMSNGLQRSSSGAPPVRLPIGTPQKATSFARSHYSCRISRSEHCTPRPIPARCSVKCWSKPSQMADRSASCTRFHCRMPKHFGANSLGSADRGERIVLGAFDGAELIGTVTLLLKLSQNQPHRAEIAKMLTRLSHRHRGVATALLREAERTAIEHGRWLLVLDTAEDEGAAGLYERVGFQARRIDPGLRLQALRWAHRDADLLEAVARARARLS